MRDILRLLDDSLRGTRTAELANKVFDIPEHLESILAFLPNDDLLRAYRISHGFQDVIQGSLKLQRKLGLRAHAQTSPYLPPRSVPRWFSFLDESSIEKVPGDAKSLRVPLRIEAMEYTKKLGHRCSSVLVSQPPIQALNVYTSCCDSRYSAPQPLETINASAGSVGITVGDVNQALKRLRPLHRLCPHADRFQHKATGEVEVMFTFLGHVQVDETNPVVRSPVLMKEKLKKDDALKSELPAYVRAKQAAHTHDLPIPTFAEFRAQQIKDEKDSEDGQGPHNIVDLTSA